MSKLGKNKKSIFAGLLTVALLGSPTAAFAENSNSAAPEIVFPDRADFLTESEMVDAVSEATQTSFSESVVGEGLSARAGETFCKQDSQLPHVRTKSSKQTVGAKPTITCGTPVGTLGLTATLYQQTAAGWYKVAGPQKKTNHDAAKIQITNLEYVCKTLSPKRNYRVIVDGVVGYYGKPLISGSSYGDSKEKLACS
ncbi:hypothetical protein [Leucobacter chromiiresistens]|uniref:hypothetical protein n=1 Tax=Leucobacter chromiiresistens TaxID=1079994 RepID=UPI000A9F65F7|nr:hypothetical protein [Leucobacter chromiiresistens]